jgi:ankyrin repeat protein
VADRRAVPSDSPLARDLITAIKGGDRDRLGALLATKPELATGVITEPDGGARTLLHVLADAPGHRPRAAATVGLLVAAGADLNAAAVGMWHSEAPLHWAASNNDTVLIDALLDAGADIECPGSSIGGGPPVQSALGYGQWLAVRRLFERGATATLSVCVVLGLTERAADIIAAGGVTAEDLNMSLWNACRVGDVVLARLLLSRGADPDWRAPWSGQAPADIAAEAGQQHLVDWLAANGSAR